MSIALRIRSAIAPILAIHPNSAWVTSVPEEQLSSNADHVWVAAQDNGEAHLAQRISDLLDELVDAPVFITTEAELEELPVGSTVLAHWEDGSQPDYHLMRCREGGASSSGFGVASGKHWTNLAN